LTEARGVPRFPGYDVLSQRSHWDAETYAAVMERLAPHLQRSFFSEAEERICRPLLDRLLANDDEGRQVPVFEMIDLRLATGSTDGWRYADMPPDAEAWRRSLAELERLSFASAGRPRQQQMLEAVRTSDKFAGMPAPRLWSLWLRYTCTAYYSHPWAWNEIGFGGPAYPRGYKNIGIDKREPWEVQEVDAHDPIPWAQRVEAARHRHGDPERQAGSRP